VKRVSPTERIRAEIDELFSSERDLSEVLEEVGRVATRLVEQIAIEAEVTEFLGRERYARGERAREGSRNGYAPVTVKTTAGPVELSRPKLRGTDEDVVDQHIDPGRPWSTSSASRRTSDWEDRSATSTSTCPRPVARTARAAPSVPAGDRGCAPIVARPRAVALPLPPVPPGDQHVLPGHRLAVDLFHVRAPSLLAGSVARV